MTSPTTEPSADGETDAFARGCASARANALCDEIDRRRHELIGLRVELEGAIAVCRALLRDGAQNSDLEAMARAKRLRDEMAG